jgi:hypothetical protein
LCNIGEVRGLWLTFHKFQSPNPKFQTIFNHQAPITKRFIFFGNFDHSCLPVGRGILVIVWELACLREAASAKAGAWKLVLYDS